ncbi:MAG: twin-arginine translocase subunit TatB [Acidobacteria bacterium]|nr:twin-arginine translocase subunit TatB [Acidobacteriota bacterium]
MPSTGEMFVIFVLALVIFGPKKLPEIARHLGKALNEFRRASNEFRSQLEEEIRQIDVAEQAKKMAELPQNSIAPPPEAIANGALPSETNRLEPPQSAAAAAAESGEASHQAAQPSAPLPQELNG